MVKNEPKILFLDIETKYLYARIWRPGDQFVPHTAIKDGDKPDIICVCYKWAHENVIHSLDWGQSQNSGPMMRKLAKVVKQADVVIGQNSDAFDIKHVNLQNMLHKKDRIWWPQTEDLKIQLQRHFNFPSNSLDYVAKVLLGEGKSSMTDRDWVNIVEYKCKKTLEKMIKYCQRDVQKTAAVWNRVRKYITPKAIVNKRCPKCATTASVSKGNCWDAKEERTRQRRQCLSCGTLFKADIRQHP